MMELHVPIRPTMTLPDMEVFITEGLDAVIIGRESSTVYNGYVMFRVTGNPRDCAIACERSEKLGGVVD